VNERQTHNRQKNPGRDWLRFIRENFDRKFANCNSLQHYYGICSHYCIISSVSQVFLFLADFLIRWVKILSIENRRSGSKTTFITVVLVPITSEPDILQLSSSLCGACQTSLQYRVFTKRR